MASSICNSLIAVANKDLTIQLQTLVGATDESHAFLVRAGLLQDDPTPGVSILTHTNDPAKPGEWWHSVVAGPEEKLSPHIDAYEIGGAELWWRRFTTTLTQFWSPTDDRSTAEQLASLVLARSEYALKNLNLNSIGADDYGETPLMIHIVSSYNHEAGGPGQFIWRGQVRWQVLTIKS